MRGPNRRSVERELEMARLYAAGQTLQQIGEQFGMTRERVRQLIKRQGMSRNAGGAYKRSQANQAEKAAAAKARRDARTILYYGCAYAELVELNEGELPCVASSNAGKYKQQKSNALTRGVPWAITFPQWLQVWHESGHWEDRGRRRDAYVMARRGDTGAYALGNVYITTLANNVSDYQAALKRRGVECSDGYIRLPEKASRISTKTGRRASPLGKGRGWTRTKHGRYQVVVGSKYIGTFATPEEATTAYREAVEELQKEAA